MNEIIKKINQIDWEYVAGQLHQNGYAVVADFLSDIQCQNLIEMYDDTPAFRKKVMMERYRFGLGEYQYFDYPLPDIVQVIRENIYAKLVPVANLWMRRLRIDQEYPESFLQFQAECHAKGQLKPTPLLLKYGTGGFNTLHQDLYGEVYFPIQTIFMLNQPGVDYTGGELVLTQQIPRAQSKAIVLKPKKGELVILATRFKPSKGVKAYYRVNMKHGVSEVQSGGRHTLGVIFHDAIN